MKLQYLDKTERYERHDPNEIAWEIHRVESSKDQEYEQRRDENTEVELDGRNVDQGHEK